MKQALKILLNQLDEIASQHEEIEDTDVREQMAEAIDKSFVQPEHGYVLPNKFGMFSTEGDAAVRKALGAFLNHPEVIAARAQLPKAVDRLNAFQDESVVSDQGRRYDDYFGYLEPDHLQ
ncbi:MAG: hypothetical protein JO251_17060 [Verrucomicrobia bacterium]|nr:hypothetical protein [Verrucomicrobiota bacterium]